MAQAQAGDIIELAAGNYGDVWIYNKKFASEVIIRSADPDDPAVFDTGKFQVLENVTIEGIKFDFEPDENTVEANSAVQITDSKSVTLRDSVIEGGVSIAGIPEDSPPGTQGSKGIMGQPIGRAISAFRNEDITIENNELTSFFKGIVTASIDGLTVSGNEAHGLRGSPLVGADLHNVLVEENYFHQSFPWKLGGKGDHGDYIHFWTTKAQTEPSQNFVIRDNFFEQGSGDALVGINLEGIGGYYGFKDVVIDNNVIHNGDSQAMRLSAVHGLEVTNNTLLQSSGGLNDAPLIVMVDGTRDAIVRDNLTAGINGNAFEDAGVNNITTSGNIVINYTDADAANYVGNMFVNSSNSADGLENIRVIPGSPADGVGSTLTAFDLTPEELTAGFRVDSLEGSAETLIFDATSLTFGPDGHVGEGEATFTWTFGDGATATGPLVQRSYEDAGMYDVELTVRTPDGSVSVAMYEVGVAGRELVSFDASTGTFLDHGYGETDAASATIENLVNNGAEKAIVLGGTGVQATVSQSAFGDVFGADNFKMGMTLKSTAGSSSAGEVFRIHGSFVGRIDEEGNFIFEMFPVGGARIYTQSTGINMNDGQPHDIQIALNDETGRLNVRIDGELSSTTDLVAEFAEFPRDLTFGSPFVGGVNYQGELSAFYLESYEPDYRVFTGDEGEIETGSGGNPVNPIDDVILDIASLAGNVRVLRDDASVVTTEDGSAIQFDGEQDHAKLGRLKEIAESDELAVSIDFSRSSADGEEARLFWNNKKLGMKLDEDGFVVRAATADDGFKAFRVNDIGLNDLDEHNAVVMLDTENDRLQVTIDGVLVLDETDTDFEFSGPANGKQPGWTLSAVHKRFFEGDVSDFRVDTAAEFLDEQVYNPDSGLLI